MYYSLQVLRGLSAWAVVFHHIAQSFYKGEISHWFWLFFEQYGNLGVYVFFILSGFVISLAAKKYSNLAVHFLLLRLIRVFPVYWFYTIILIISILILPDNIFLTSWDYKSFAASFFLIPNINPNGYGYFPTLYVGWSLTYEVFFYFLFSVALIKIKTPTLFCFLLLLVIAIIFRWQPFLGQSSLLLLGFNLGILLYFIFVKLDAVKLKVYIWAFFFICLLALPYINENNILFRLLVSFEIVLFFLLVDFLFVKKSRSIKFLLKLGNISYSTYLAHVIVIGWFYYLDLLLQGKLDIGVYSVFGILLCTYWLSIWSYKTVEIGFLTQRMKQLVEKLN
jgi:exopolysaccharide production protein ExoZ